MIAKNTKILIAVLIVAIFAAAAIPFKIHNTAFVKDSDTIEYKGRIYHRLTMYANLYEFEIDKRVSSLPYESIYTIKNDKNSNFLYYSPLHESMLYTDFPINEDYFSYPIDIKEVRLNVDGEIISITNEDDIDCFHNIKYFGSSIKRSYNPDDCLIIKANEIQKDNLPVRYDFEEEAFIYDGTEWLISAGFEVDSDTNDLIYYAYDLSNTYLRSVFLNFADKYFPEIISEKFDYDFYYRLDTLKCDPSMATIAD